MPGLLHSATSVSNQPALTTNQPTSRWVFNLGFGIDNDSDSDSDEPTQAAGQPRTSNNTNNSSFRKKVHTSAQPRDDATLLRELDISTREDTVVFRPNPWSIAKVNAATRGSKGGISKARSVSSVGVKRNGSNGLAARAGESRGRSLAKRGGVTETSRSGRSDGAIFGKAKTLKSTKRPGLIQTSGGGFIHPTQGNGFSGTCAGTLPPTGSVAQPSEANTLGGSFGVEAAYTEPNTIPHNYDAPPIRNTCGLENTAHTHDDSRSADVEHPFEQDSPLSADYLDASLINTDNSREYPNNGHLIPYSQFPRPQHLPHLGQSLSSPAHPQSRTLFRFPSRQTRLSFSQMRTPTTSRQMKPTIPCAPWSEPPVVDNRSRLTYAPSSRSSHHGQGSDTFAPRLCSPVHVPGFGQAIDGGVVPVSLDGAESLGDAADILFHNDTYEPNGAYTEEEYPPLPAEPLYPGPYAPPSGTCTQYPDNNIDSKGDTDGLVGETQIRPTRQNIKRAKPPPIRSFAYNPPLKIRTEGALPKIRLPSPPSPISSSPLEHASATGKRSIRSLFFERSPPSWVTGTSKWSKRKYKGKDDDVWGTLVKRKKVTREMNVKAMTKFKLPLFRRSNSRKEHAKSATAQKQCQDKTSQWRLTVYLPPPKGGKVDIPENKTTRSATEWALKRVSRDFFLTGDAEALRNPSTSGELLPVDVEKKRDEEGDRVPSRVTSGSSPCTPEPPPVLDEQHALGEAEIPVAPDSDANTLVGESTIGWEGKPADGPCVVNAGLEGELVIGPWIDRGSEVVAQVDECVEGIEEYDTDQVFRLDLDRLANNYPHLREQILERKRAARNVWNELDLPSCGIVFSDITSQEDNNPGQGGWEMGIMSWPWSGY